MIARIALLFISFFINGFIHGQSLSMKLKMHEHFDFYPLIVEAKLEDLNHFIEKNKAIRIGSSLDNYHTIYTNKEIIKELYKQPWVKRIEDGMLEIRPLMDSSRILNNIDSVHFGNAPLLTNYKGRNVLIGIIDWGIEWRHLDFKNSPSKTRILALWDQNKDSIPPAGYSYGHLWTKDAIDSGFCNHAANISNSHGTNVSGIAVGNGNSYSPNRGIAPEAKIAFVSLKNNVAWLTNVLDGINYIFKLADSLYIPAVINLSVGTYDGSHDGRDLSTRMIEASLNKKGRVIVAAAGNAGNLNQHIRMTPNNDTSFTDFTYSSSFQGSYFNFWADTSEVRNLTIGLQADSNPTLLPLSNSYFFPFKTRFLDSLIQYGYYEDSMIIKNNLDSPMGKAFFYVLKQENTVNFQCYIKPRKTSYLWRFTATGEGKLDLWVHPSLQTTSAIYSSPLPSAGVNASISQYKLSDQSYSLVSGFQCSDKIITVGNYVNKYGITDIDTIYRPIGGKQNEIASNSSKGPTRDGRIKPDIVASGGQTLTTIDSITGAAFAANAGNRKKLGITGKYVVAGGTSMASPVVSGSLALLLEKKASYWSHEMLYLLKKTAKRDSFTTPIENNTYGYGKINGFQLLSYQPSYGCRDTGSINYNPNTDFEDSILCIKKIYGCTDTGSINYNPLANLDNGTCIKKVYGCTDTGSINFNPLANVDNGSCIKKVYGCMDSTATNYNPKANIDDGSCLYSNSQVQNLIQREFSISPNPTKDKIQIKWHANQNSIFVNIYSSIGVKVFEGLITKKDSISLKNLTPGVYYLLVYHGGQMENYKILLE
jgi:subtilisin family serine protease